MQRELDEFSVKNGVTVDWCGSCLCFTTYCPECSHNECGGCHDKGCQSIKFSQQMQDKLNDLVDNWGKAK